MAAPITNATQIRTAWLLDWYMSDIDHWAVTTAPFNITANSLTYLASPLPTSVGRLADTAKASDTELSIAFSGIDLQFKQMALTSVLTGRPFNVYRVYFNPDYSVQTIAQRYSGLITSVSFDEDYPANADNRGEASVSEMLAILNSLASQPLKLSVTLITSPAFNPSAL